MTNEDIKKECLSLYAQILTCNTKLSAIRKECKHEKTFMGKYEVKAGRQTYAHICEYCGEKLL